VFFLYTIVAIFRGAAYVPTTHSQVKRLLDLAAISPGEKLLDLGSGDGRILLAAAKRGAICVGIEINPLLCWYSKLRMKLCGAQDVTVTRTNFWSVSLSDIDVLTVYLVPQRMEQLKAKVFAEMRSGSRIVTSIYHFPEWAPERREGDICIFRVP
jgi:16S rRNA A1518/A1519 N6-dimethyltransferase RsmA/KsgA/DIM1 with predicted DNA glycosylase/AP lyase activity